MGQALGRRIFPDNLTRKDHVLPFVEKHRDPFDRLLVWQCIRNELTLLTSDRALRGYRQHGLKLAT